MVGNCLLVALLGWTLAYTGRAGPVPATPPVDTPASRPAREAPATTRPAAGIRRLILRLGHPEYRVREAAQAELAALGEAALPHLADFIASADPEIANRVASLIHRPSDPALRVEIAARLLATADPDRMQPAVYMLFEEPLVDYPRFAERTKAARGLQRAIFEPVLDQLGEWRKITQRHLRRQAKLIRENRPEVAERERKRHKESRFYQAEAAYWQAVDALETFREERAKRRGPASRPAG